MSKLGGSVCTALQAGQHNTWQKWNADKLEDQIMHQPLHS